MIAAVPIRYVILFFIILISFLKVEGQEIRLSFHHLSEKNGLSQSDKYFLSRDSKGIAWIGSDDGLLHFDGKRIKQFKSNPEDPQALLENKITSKCFEDVSGNLWFSSNNALNCYYRTEDKFTNFSISGNLKYYHVFDLADGKIWLQIGKGKERALYLFDIDTHKFDQRIPVEGEECVIIKKEENVSHSLISTALPDQTGLVWTDLKGGSKKHVDFIYTRMGERRRFASPTKGTFIDQDGLVWTGLYDGIGSYIAGQDSGFVEISRVATVPADIGWVKGITAYDQHRLLVVADVGLLVFDKPKGMFVQHFSSDPKNPYSLKLKNLNEIAVDSSGVLWLSNAQQEVAFAHLGKNRFPILKETQHNFISNISEDEQQRIWVSTVDSGAFVYNQQKELLFRTTSIRNKSDRAGYFRLPAINFFIANEPGQWWGNVDNNFFLWQSKEKEFDIKPTYFFGVSSTEADNINYCYQLKNGKKLIARGADIYKLRMSEQKVDTIRWHNLEYLQLETINIIFEDDENNIYIGDKSGRLIVLKEENNQIRKMADLKGVGLLNAFKTDAHRKLIWVASSKGLGTIDPTNYKLNLFNEYDQGLADEPIYDVLIDQTNQLWLPSNNGLLRYNPEAKKTHRFGLTDGLLSTVFNRNVNVVASKSGAFWIGSKNGVNIFEPEQIQLLEVKPNVQISRFLINDEPYEIEGNLAETEHLTFNYDENTLSFEFVALDFSDPLACNYFCQMVGYDDEPIGNGRRNFIRYGNLPAGNYTFKVWATNSDGVKNEEPLNLGIKIIPPFYQTWWFYAICLILAAAIVYAVFQYRLEQALKVERLRVKISSDLHDDVGGLLSGLAMQTELLELKATEELKPKFQRISELSRKAMSRMRDTVWAIDARKDKFENLIDRMHEHAEETLAPLNIHYNIITKNIDLKTSIPTDVRQNLYLIYKEAITNTAKHSNAQSVEIGLENSNGNFEMYIEDNGQVREKNYKTTGMGLSNMQMRAKQINAVLETNNSAGFKIFLKMKSLT